MATKLLLIRHGQTEWNLQGRYCGFLDIDLNGQGIIQAERLAARLKGQEIHKIYCSDRKRAIQTAEIIFKGREFEKAADLREINFGIFEGLTYNEIMGKHPEIYKKWYKDPLTASIPQGENLSDFKTRVINNFKSIVNFNPHKTVAVVSHGGVISIFINDILQTEDFWNKIPDSTSLTIIECENGQAKIKILNDTLHLSG